MKNTKMRYGPRVLSAATALATVATLSVGAAPAARAATPASPPVTGVTSIVGGIGSVPSYIGYAKTAYGLFVQYASELPKPLTDLQKIQAAITASTVAINAHDDALTNGLIKACVDDADIALEGITTASPDAQMAAAAAAAGCVTKAKNEIPAEGQAGVDTLGFALNTVGPVALFLQAYVGQPTDILLQDIISANQALTARLQPTCGVTPDVNVHNTVSAGSIENPVPGDIAHAPIPGHGTCYNYTHPTPGLTDGHVTYFPTGVGTGSNPWTVTGDGVPEICALAFYCGDHVDWPSVSDYSIAVDQAMASTSYPVAQAALLRLLPAASGTSGSRVAVVSSTVAAHGFEAFRVSATGKLMSATMAVDQAAAASWTPVAGAPELQSVAAASNADGRLEVFGINRLGQIFHRWQQTPADDTSWSPWARMDGQLNSIAVARNDDGTLQVFGTNQFGNVWTRHQVLGADRVPSWQLRFPPPAVDFWSPWKQMDGSMYQVAAGTDFRGRIELFAIDAHGAMSYRSQNGPSLTDPTVAGNWSAWSSMGVKASSIAVTLDFGLSFEVLATMGNTVNQIEEFAPGSFATAAPVGGGIHGDLAVAKAADGFVVLLALDASGDAYTNLDNGGFVGGWTGWRSSEPPVLAQPVSAAGGKVTLSWTDQSTIEDGFAVFQFKRDGTMVAEIADLRTPNKAGTGETITTIDSAPAADPTQQCYKVYAYDDNGTFGSGSDIVCR